MNPLQSNSYDNVIISIGEGRHRRIVEFYCDGALKPLGRVTWNHALGVLGFPQGFRLDLAFNREVKVENGLNPLSELLEHAGFKVPDKELFMFAQRYCLGATELKSRHMGYLVSEESFFKIVNDVKTIVPDCDFSQDIHLPSSARRHVKDWVIAARETGHPVFPVNQCAYDILRHVNKAIVRRNPKMKKRLVGLEDRYAEVFGKEILDAVERIEEIERNFKIDLLEASVEVLNEKMNDLELSITADHDLSGLRDHIELTEKLLTETQNGKDRFSLIEETSPGTLNDSYKEFRHIFSIDDKLAKSNKILTPLAIVGLVAGLGVTAWLIYIIATSANAQGNPAEKPNPGFSKPINGIEPK